MPINSTSVPTLKSTHHHLLNFQEQLKKCYKKKQTKTIYKFFKLNKKHQNTFKIHHFTPSLQANDSKPILFKCNKNVTTMPQLDVRLTHLKKQKDTKMALDALETARQEIAKIYFAAFNRAAEPDGLQNWLNQYTAGLMDYSAISENFSAQTEYITTYPLTQSSADYITSIYFNVFGRAPDAGGLQNWINQLENPDATGFNKGNIMSALLDSAGSAGNTDGMRLDNKAAVNLSLIDNGTTDAAFMEKALAAVTADANTVDIVNSIITMAATDSTALENAIATLESVKAMLEDTASEATLETTLENLKTMMETIAQKIEDGTITDIAATLQAATTTVEAAKLDPTYLDHPETLADDIETDPTAAQEDAQNIVDEGEDAVTPSAGGGGGSTPATFTVAQDDNGDITFGGTATGNISISWSDGINSVATFSRGGTTAQNSVDYSAMDSYIVLAEGQTLAGTVSDFVNSDMESYIMISGDGTVNITGLENDSWADLSYINTNTLTATIDTTPQNQGEDGIVSNNNFGSAVVTVIGTGSLTFDMYAYMGDASFIIEEHATLNGNSDTLSGLTVSGPGYVEVLLKNSYEDDTDLSNFSESLHITASSNREVSDISANSNLGSVDEFYVGTYDYDGEIYNSKLVLTAEQAVNKLITGAGDTTVNASVGNQTIDVETTGINDITGGLGQDIIILNGIEDDNGAYTYAGTDTIHIGGGTSVEQLTLAVTDAQDRLDAGFRTPINAQLDATAGEITDEVAALELIQTTAQTAVNEFNALVTAYNVAVDAESMFASLVADLDTAKTATTSAQNNVDGMLNIAGPATVEEINAGLTDFETAVFNAEDAVYVTDVTDLNYDALVATLDAAIVANDTFIGYVTDLTDAQDAQGWAQDAVDSGFRTPIDANADATSQEITDESTVLTSAITAAAAAVINGLTIAPEVQGDITTTVADETDALATIYDTATWSASVFSGKVTALNEANAAVQAGTLSSDSTPTAADMIINFDPAHDILYMGVSTAIAADGVVDVNNAGNRNSSTDDVLIANTSYIAFAGVTSGVVTFGDESLNTMITIDSTAKLTAALTYLSAQIADFNNVAFDYNIGGTAGTYVFQGDAGGDMAVNLIGVTAASLGADLNMPQN